MAKDDRPRPRFRSEELPRFKKLIESLPDLKCLVGDFFEVRAVVDTNVVIQTVIRLTKGKPTPALLELMRSSALEVHAPTKLVSEIEQHLPAIAQKKGLNLDEMRKHWLIIRAQLKFTEIDSELLSGYEESRDPGDAEFVILEKMIDAIGVVSDDKDLDDMSRRRLSMDFLMMMRNHAREEAVVMGLHIEGFGTAYLSAAAFIGLFKLLKSLWSTVKRIPGWVWALIIVVLILAWSHRPTRERFKQVMADFGHYIKAGINYILEHLGEGSEELRLAKEGLTTIRDEIDAYLDDQGDLGIARVGS
ncbi:MAG: PIN domain-containing protein [Gammaproteobacteria bacterium]